MKKKSSFLRILGFMKQHMLTYWISLVIIGILYLFLQVSLAYLFKDMFNLLTKNQFNHLFDEIKYYIGYIILIILVLPIFTYLANRVNVMITANIQKAVADKLTKLPAAYFKKNHSGDIISRCTNDITETERAYKVHLINFVTNLIMGIGSVIFIFILEWRLAFVALGGGLLVLFINVIYSKILKSVSTEVQEKLAKLNERFSNLIAGFHVIKVFNLSQLMMKKYLTSNEAVYDASKKRVEKQSVMNTLNTLVSFVSFLGIVLMGSYLFISNEINEFGVIVAVVQLQSGITNLVYGLGSFMTQMQSSLAAADRVFELIDEEEEPKSYHLTDNRDIASLDAIDFDCVSFGYDDEKVLNGLSFKLPRNKVYALVGPSGGGKSTVFKLILNFYSPQGGNIHFDGKSISNQEIKAIRNQIAYVPQDAYLFTGTIEDNIRYGRMGATHEEIIEAAKQANAHDFIMELDRGYETQVGESGAQLSGGQRQRIAIARAILKDAPILLLDEATSALDSESEQLVQEALEKLMVNKTTLIIAHRLSTVEHADQILVISDGQVVEQGTHTTLLENQGLYSTLYQKQFATS